MRASDFDGSYTELNELAVIRPIKNWFNRQIQRQQMSKGADELKTLVNGNIKMLVQYMGRYGVTDWDVLPMQLLYYFMRLQLKLSDQDVLQSVNKVMQTDGLKNTKANNKPTLTLAQIKNPQDDLKVVDLWPKPLVNKSIKVKTAAEIAEKIVTQAAMQQMLNKWQQDAGVELEQPTTSSAERSASGRFVKKPAEAPAAEPTGLAKVAARAKAARASATPAAAATVSPSAEDIAAALNQLGASP